MPPEPAHKSLFLAHVEALEPGVDANVSRASDTCPAVACVRRPRTAAWWSSIIHYQLSRSERSRLPALRSMALAIEGVSPYLRYEDADAALDWLERVLGFTGAIRWRDDSGRTFEADIHAGVTKIGVSGGGVSDAGKNALFIVHVDDVDAHFELVRSASGMELDAPVDQPYGPRTFTITDPWGYQWSFWQGEATPPQ